MMNWFWKVEKEEPMNELDVAIKENKKELRRKVRQSQKQRRESSDLLKLSEDALKYLEGLEKKDGT